MGCGAQVVAFQVSISGLGLRACLDLDFKELRGWLLSIIVIVALATRRIHHTARLS